MNFLWVQRIVTLCTLALVVAGPTGCGSGVFNSGWPNGIQSPPAAAQNALVFATQPSNISEGSFITPFPAVHILGASGALAVNSSAVVTLGLMGGGTLSGPTTAVAVGGIATFPGLSIATPGPAYSLIASATDLSGAVSNAFAVTPPTAQPVGLTILQNAAPSLTASPGGTFQITYRWEATTLSSDYSVSVAFINSAGATAFRDDHQPPVPTSQWTGAVSYTRKVTVPPSAGPGSYKVIASLNSSTGPLPLVAGTSVLPAGVNQYQTGGLDLLPSCSIANFGAIGDGVTDNANAIQMTFDYAATNRCVAFVPPGRFAYSGTVTASGIAVAGSGASSVLAPIDPDNEALILSGDGGSISDLVLVSQATSRLSTPWSGMIWLDNASNFYVENVLIDNSSSTGIMSLNSHDGFVLNNTVENTLADSITQINGSYNLVVSGNSTLKSGDDGISSNSYHDVPLVHDITVSGNNVIGNLWGRGIEVSGGSNIAFTDNYVDNPDGFSDVYIASESEFNTLGVDHITVTGNTLVEGGPNQGTAILYNSQGGLYTITNVTVSSNEFWTPQYVAVQLAGNGKEAEIQLLQNTAYSSGNFVASGNPLSSFTSTANQVIAPSGRRPSPPPGRGCNFIGC